LRPYGAGADIDPSAVLRSMAYPEPADIEPVLGGWDTAIWRFATEDGARHILRLFRSPDRAPAATRERVALQSAAAAGLPVPAVEAFGAWQDRPAMILSWCSGEQLVRCIQRKPWTILRLSRQLGQLQARIHAAPVAEALREGAPSYWLERTGGGNEFDASSLEAAGLNCGTFVHMDFHPLNVLSDGRTITGVVDWTNAAAGDARADLAWTTTLLRIAPIPPSRLLPLFRTVRWLFYLGWRRGYESLAGPIPELAPFMVWAGTVFLREVLPRIDEPQVWATQRDLEAVRRWIARWKRRAGIT
jgi:aminoglycoside phosphotransferase (APT) family kinase protein